MNDFAAFEALVATAKARISSSSINVASSAKEPFDGPVMLAPIAYAMLEFLCEACIATGHDDGTWWMFLREALDECIARAERKTFD